MSTVAQPFSRHPLTSVVVEAGVAMREALEVPIYGAGPGELRRLVREVNRLAATVSAVEATVLAQAERDQVAAEKGATSTANWVAHRTRQTHVEAHRRMRLAKDLDQHEATFRALAHGEVLPEQARVILDALAEVAKIPEDLVEQRHLDRNQLAKTAEQWLVKEARHHDAKALQTLGRRILDVVVPEVAEEHERRLLEAQERRAQQKMRFTMADDGHGCVHGRFTLPVLQAAMLKKALLGLAAPKHRAATHGAATNGGALRAGQPSAQRMGQAFREYVERYPVDRSPHAGGAAATVVLTMDLEKLKAGLGAGVLDDGGRISATEVRRLACEAGIIPAVLGGKGQPLDVGRRRRFHTESQRIALAIRDQGCTAEGCDYPPGLCHAHHDPPWGAGHGTSVSAGRLLCPKHHHLAHDPRYQTSRLGTGKLRFSRRT